MFIEHIAFNIPDPVAAADWYCNHLAMRIISINRQSPAGAFLSDSNGMMLELYDKTEARHLPLADLAPATLHLAISSQSIEADVSRLVEAGCSMIGGIEETPRGDSLAFLRDPFGLCLQLAQRATRHHR